MCFWNGDSFVESVRYCHPKFAVVKGFWAFGVGPWRLLCLDAPNELSERIIFFDSIISFVLNWECRDFIIFGYFNSTMHGEEWWGVNGFGNVSDEFWYLVDAFDLHDLPL